MKSISIRELHEKTGQWVRQAADFGPIVVTHHGRPLADLHPHAPSSKANPFKERALLPEYKKIKSIPVTGVDSAEIIAEDRDRA